MIGYIKMKLNTIKNTFNNIIKFSFKDYYTDCYRRTKLNPKHFLNLMFFYFDF